MKPGLTNQAREPSFGKKVTQSRIFKVCTTRFNKEKTEHQSSQELGSEIKDKIQLKR